MSEELTNSSTQGQNLAQKGSMSFPDFNITLHVHVTASPALQAVLERIAAAIVKQEDQKAFQMQEVVFRGLNKEQTTELVEKGVIDQAMAGVAPVQRKHKPAAAPKKYSKVKWTDIPKHPHLRYREEADKLILNYAGSIVETTWMAVESTARLDPKYWKHEIEKMLGARLASNRRAAISLFIKLFEKGDVSRVTISQFQSDEGTGVSA